MPEHRNSIAYKIHTEGTDEQKLAFNRWRRRILDDASAFNSWAKDGCSSGSAPLSSVDDEFATKIKDDNDG